MNFKRHKIFALFGIWLTISLAFISVKGMYAGWNNDATDFNNYYVSSKLLIANEPIHQFYDNDWFTEKALENGIINGAKFSPFTPTTPLLYLPISGFDLLTAKRLWLVFNILLLLVLPFRLKKYFQVPLLQTLFICSLFFVPISSNLNFGQAYLVLTFFMIEAVGLAIHRKKVKFASGIIAFCTLLKYLPVLFLLYFIKQQSKTIVIAFTASIIALIIVVYFIDPLAYNSYYNVLFSHLQGDLSGQGKYAIGFQSIDALLNNLFVFDAIENPSPLVSAPLFKPILKLILFLAVGGACLYLFKADRFQLTSLNSSIFIVGAFILFPASASYHFLFLIIPVVFIYSWLSELSSKLPLICFVVILLTVFVVQQHHIPQITGWPTTNLLLHFPRLWSLIFLFSFLFLFKLKVDSKANQPGELA